MSNPFLHILLLWLLTTVGFISTFVSFSSLVPWPRKPLYFGIGMLCLGLAATVVLTSL